MNKDDAIYNIKISLTGFLFAKFSDPDPICIMMIISAVYHFIKYLSHDFDGENFKPPFITLFLIIFALSGRQLFPNNQFPSDIIGQSVMVSLFILFSILEIRKPTEIINNVK